MFLGQGQYFFCSWLVWVASIARQFSSNQTTVGLSRLKRYIKEFWQHASFSPHFPSESFFETNFFAFKIWPVSLSLYVWGKNNTSIKKTELFWVFFSGSNLIWHSQKFPSHVFLSTSPIFLTIMGCWYFSLNIWIDWYVIKMEQKLGLYIFKYFKSSILLIDPYCNPGCGLFCETTNRSLPSITPTDRKPINQ